MAREVRQAVDGGGRGRHRIQSLEVDLDRLQLMDMAEPRSGWETRFGSPLPTALTPHLTRLALAHDLQCRALGGLKPVVERRLQRASGNQDGARDTTLPPLKLKPGAVLLRDWGGRSWRVEVAADGSFAFEGRKWRSLSAIAKKITGTGRNGPAFFGLRGGATNGQG